MLLFNHDVLHEGTTVGGTRRKYLLWAEVMFSRVDILSGRHKRDVYALSDSYCECRRLHKEAAIHESKGDAAQFCSTYLKALQL